MNAEVIAEGAEPPRRKLESASSLDVNLMLHLTATHFKLLPHRIRKIIEN